MKVLNIYIEMVKMKCNNTIQTTSFEVGHYYVASMLFENRLYVMEQERERELNRTTDTGLVHRVVYLY